MLVPHFKQANIFSIMLLNILFFFSLSADESDFNASYQKLITLAKEAKVQEFKAAYARAPLLEEQKILLLKSVEALLQDKYKEWKNIRPSFSTNLKDIPDESDINQIEKDLRGLKIMSFILIPPISLMPFFASYKQIQRDDIIFHWGVLKKVRAGTPPGTRPAADIARTCAQQIGLKLPGIVKLFLMIGGISIGYVCFYYFFWKKYLHLKSISYAIKQTTEIKNHIVSSEKL